MVNKMDLDNRFWSKVHISDTHSYKGTPCWEWTACKGKYGYGQFRLNGKGESSHRLSYEYFKGKIPEDLVINHLCRNKCCLNPEKHLEAVTQKENILKGLAGFKTGLQQRLKTHCPQGHPYSKENTYVRPIGSRECRICYRRRNRQNRQRKRMEKIIIG